MVRRFQRVHFVWQGAAWQLTFTRCSPLKSMLYGRISGSSGGAGWSGESTGTSLRTCYFALLIVFFVSLRQSYVHRRGFFPPRSARFNAPSTSLDRPPRLGVALRPPCRLLRWGSIRPLPVRSPGSTTSAGDKLSYLDSDLVRVDEIISPI